MVAEWLIFLASSDFEALQDDNGTWYINQYFKVPGESSGRRETVQDSLTHKQALGFVKNFRELSKKSMSLLNRLPEDSSSRP